MSTIKTTKPKGGTEIIGLRPWDGVMLASGVDWGVGVDLHHAVVLKSRNVGKISLVQKHVDRIISVIANTKTSDLADVKLPKLRKKILQILQSP